MDVSLSGGKGRAALALSLSLNLVLLGVVLWPDSDTVEEPVPAVAAAPQLDEAEEALAPADAAEEAANEANEADEADEAGAPLDEDALAEAAPEEDSPVEAAPEGIQVTVAKVEGSIPQTLAKAAAPYGDFVSATLSRILVWDHDLRRDLRAGDKIEVAWSLGTSDTVVIEATRFHSQKFNRTTSAYRFQATGDKFASYWSADGTEIPHVLKKSPLKEYEQITSLLKDRPTHKGMDFKVDVGTPIYASFPGTVTRVNWNWKYNGNSLEVKQDDGVYAKYLHLSENKVKAGDRLKPGQVIALTGNTGRSTGPHLHYQLNKGASGKVIDPIDYHGTQRRSLPEGDRAAFAEVVKASNARLDTGRTLAAR